MDAKQIKVNGITYEVLRSRPFAENGKQRHQLQLRKPNDPRVYLAVMYPGGAVGGLV